MTHWEIRQESLAVIRAMAGSRADRYLGEVLLPALARETRAADGTITSIREALRNPYRCLEAMYLHYAFSRRGKDRSELASQALAALHQCGDEADFEVFLQLPNASSLWSAYVDVCAQRGKKPMEQLNRGVIAGLAELAQEIYTEGGSGSIATWVFDAVMRTGRIEDQFMRMVDIRGVGPKLSSLFMRDVVCIFNLEDQIDPMDRLFLQPMDKWLRLIAPHVVEELQGDDAADWVLAGKIAKYCRKAGVSGIRFNMGVTYFGSREASDPISFREAIEEITRGRDRAYC